jgi:hypothetical protein
VAVEVQVKLVVLVEMVRQVAQVAMALQHLLRERVSITQVAVVEVFKVHLVLVLVA